jgi:branched-chain amino acid transport system substrate-binding protein
MIEIFTSRNRTLRTIAAALVAGAVSFVTTQAQAADPIRIGLSLSLTGPTAAAGKQVLAGLEIWRDDINAKGGLLDRPVQLV